MFKFSGKQTGASATEFLVTLPALLLLGLGTWQSALIYNAKTTLNYATFEAARVGAVEHAQSEPMRNELGLRLAPLFGGDGSPEKAIAAITRASLDVKDSRFAQIKIISPTEEAFDDFGREIVNPKTGEINFGIPNSHLRYRDRAVKTASGVNVQDANLLKIKTTYGYKLNVPLVDRVVPALMRIVDPGNSQFYNARRLPITSVATVRMQSAAWKDDNGNAGGDDGGGVIPPGDPGDTSDDGDDGQGSDPGDGNDGTGTGGNDDDTSTGDDTNNGGCESCQQASSGSGAQSSPITQTGSTSSNPLLQSSPATNSSSQITLIDDSASGQYCPINTQTGNPIHVVTGNKYQQEVDLKPLSGSLGLAFTRNYNSQSKAKGMLGYNWTHSYDHRLSYRSETDSYHLKQGDGRGIVFTPGEQTGQYLTSRTADGWLTAQGGKASWHLRDGRKFQYNSKGQLHSITAADGKTLSLHYNEQQQLFLVRDPQQRELALSYYPNGRLKTILDPTGKTTRYRYDDNGNLNNVTYADKTSRSYHYEDSRHIHALTGITDQRGIRYSSYAYDEQGRAVESKHINDVGKVSLDFSTKGQTRVTNSEGKDSIYYTDNLHGTAIVTRIDGPGCSSCSNGDVQYEYNDQLQLTKVTLKNGETTHYAYDDQGRTIRVTKSSVTGASQLIARYEYEANNLKPSAIIRPSVNPAGDHRTEVAYNEIEQPISVTEHGYRPTANNDYVTISRRTKLSYTDGNLTTIDGPRDDVKDLIQLSYDGKQRLKTLTGPDGRPLTVLSYDDYGRPIQVKSGSQSPITMAYTLQGKVASVSQYNETISYTYTETGQIKSITTAEGKTLSVDYDADDRAIALTGTDGRRVEDEINAEGQLVQRNILSANGQLLESISHLYDAHGRLQSTSRDGQLSQQYEYDESDNLVQLTDGQGNNTQINYGALGQLIDLVGPDQSKMSLHFDKKGQVAGLTDSRNNTTKQLRDDFGNLIEQVNPDTGAIRFEYDKASNQISKVDALGNVTLNKYDAANRLVEEKTPEGTTTLAYDKQSGKLSDVVGVNGRDRFEYNIEGQLITHTRSIDGLNFSTGYNYDQQQHLIEKVLPDGQVINYHYYENGKDKGKLRALTKQALLGLSQQIIIGEIDHDKTDGTTGHTAANGIRTEYHWDEAGQLTNITNNKTLNLAYNYDDYGQIIGINLNGIQQRYLYNERGRLVLADSLLGQFRYEYDSLGNRTSKQSTDLNGQTQTETYSYAEEAEGNRLLRRNKTSGNSSESTEDILNYNKAGSPTNAVDGLSYEYNSAQRPVTVSKDNQLIAAYKYNRFGQRIKKTVYQHNGKQAKIIYYLYDGHTLTAEADDQGEITAQYIYRDGHKPIAKLEKKQLYAIHSDHLGTPRLATDENSETVWSADYTPFGKADIKSQEITLNLRLPGQYEDQETGIYYNYFRDYNPDTGRYQTSDPIGLKGGLNTYAYVSGNPIGLADPLGLAEADLWSSDGTYYYPGSTDPIILPGPEATFVNKLGSVAHGAIEYLEQNAAAAITNAVKDLFSPTSLLTNAGIMAGIMAMQFVPGLNVLIDASLFAYTWWHFGSSGVTFAKDLLVIGAKIYNLDSTQFANQCDFEDALNNLSKELADAFMKFGLALTEFFDRGKRFGANSNKIEANDPNWDKTPVKKSDAENKADKDDFVLNNLRGKSNKEKGFWGEVQAGRRFEDNGYEPVGGTLRMDNVKTKADFDTQMGAWNGQNGIDGIYKKGDDWVIVESKATGNLYGNDPGGTVGNLAKPSTGRQLSDDWINNHLDKLVLDGKLTSAQRTEIKAGYNSGKTKRVLARTDENGTKFYEVDAINTNEAKVSVDADGAGIEFNL